MSDIIVAVYDAAAGLSMLLLMFVIFQAINDMHIKRTDPESMQIQRKLAFFSAAAFLGLTVCFQRYWLLQPSVISVGLVTTGFLAGLIWVLSVNALSLHMRAPPTGHGARHRALYFASRFFHKIGK
jgi:hypothetical protein